MKLTGVAGRKFLLSFLATVFLFSTGFSQLIEFPIAPQLPSTKNPTSALRTADLTPLLLPFWDDFSYTDTIGYPKTTLWQFGQSVFVNNGTGIKPPSKNAAVFDGVDSIGKPYNVNDVLAKGYADKLVSYPIRMDLVDPGLRNSVYISFFFQVRGLGEPPDNGDVLNLALLTSDNQWETVFSMENDNTLEVDSFYQMIVQISDAKFFHNKFQFRFQNFARLSGPYDTWIVDYIYLNSGRTSTDTQYPDRTISSPLSSLLKDYFAIPIKHFMENPDGNLVHPSLLLYNLKGFNDDGFPHQQPIDYSSNAVFTAKTGTQITTTTIPLDLAQDPGTTLKGLKFFNLTLNKIPPASAFDAGADSISIQLNFGVTTNDNVPPPGGDYKAALYSPIDFRFNDITRNWYTLASFYAYDDGSAEYGAGLNQTGSFLAYKFNMKSSQPDNLSGVYIYFPEFGDNTSQSLQLQIRSDLSDSPSSILYQQAIQVDRKTMNKFVYYKFVESVPVKGTFYVGWKQLSTVSIPVGLDKNTDNGDKIFYNTNGLWIQNVTVKGSIMIRPKFGGTSGGPITGIESNPVKVPIYPNPTSRTCYLSPGAINISVFDITGRSLAFDLQEFEDKVALSFRDQHTGLVVIHYWLDGRPHSEKVMVRVE